MSSFESTIQIGHYLSGIENLDDYYELARDLQRMYTALRNLEAGPVFDECGVRRKTPRSLSPRYWAWLAKYPSARLHFAADLRLIRPCLERAEQYVQDLVREQTGMCRLSSPVSVQLTGHPGKGIEPAQWSWSVLEAGLARGADINTLSEFNCECLSCSYWDKHTFLRGNTWARFGGARN
jgi:hypothetical protein